MTDQGPSLHSELARQRLILLREMPERVALTSLAFALCAMFAPPLTLLGVWAVYLLAEALGPWLQQPDRMLQRPANYAAAMAQSVLVEAAYMMAGMVWLDDDPFSKAFAVGMASMTLMHLATVRAIHLPTGLAGLAGAAGAALVANTAFWAARDDLAGLALSSATAFGALAYTLTAMMSNHRLHRSMAAEEASARAANEAKSLFLAQMSHELRTPLNAIIGMAQAEVSDLEQDPDAPATRRTRMSVLLGNARTLATILDDVTDLNATDNQRLRLRPARWTCARRCGPSPAPSATAPPGWTCRSTCTARASRRARCRSTPSAAAMRGQPVVERAAPCPWRRGDRRRAGRSRGGRHRRASGHRHLGHRAGVRRRTSARRSSQPSTAAAPPPPAPALALPSRAGWRG